MTISSTNTSWVMTYNSLTQIVLQYLERSDTAVVNAIPTFITLAEFEIAQEIKTLGQLQLVQSQLVAGNPVLQKPARWRKTVSMNYTDANGNKNPILLRKYEYLTNYWPDSANTSAPLYYADTDWDHFFIAPTPDLPYNFELLYYERLLPLSATNQTNWLTQNAPNAMLFGTLLQAVMFLKNDQRTIFEQKYQEAIQALKAEDISRVGDRQSVAVDS
jgi:hypothetical protein